MQAVEQWHTMHFPDQPLERCKAWLEVVKDEEIVET